MFELVALVLGFMVVSMVVLGVVFIIGMRRKSPLVLRAVIWLSKVSINKAQMKTAGTPGAYAAIIRHRGRVSGTAYETPVGAVATNDGFLIILPYGRSSWARNVLASGAATLVHEGRTYDVDSPEIIPLSSIASALSSSDQRMARIFRVTDALRLRRVHPVEVALAA
ncbi:MAG: hypothetical protein ACXWXY_10835 [Aeromicrobium sp.]